MPEADGGPRYEIQIYDHAWGGWRALLGEDDEPLRLSVLAAANQIFDRLTSNTRTFRYRIYDRVAAKATVTSFRKKA